MHSTGRPAAEGSKKARHAFIRLGMSNLSAMRQLPDKDSVPRLRGGRVKRLSENAQVLDVGPVDRTLKSRVDVAEQVLEARRRLLDEAQTALEPVFAVVPVLRVLDDA